MGYALIRLLNKRRGSEAGAEPSRRTVVAVAIGRTVLAVAVMVVIAMHLTH